MFPVIALLLATASVAAANPEIPSHDAAEGGAPPQAALPSGSSAAFRQRMMNWSGAPAAAPVRVNERLAGPVPARLDRLSISSRFGLRSDPLNGIRRHHDGIDLPAPFGSPVMATGPGVVRIAGWVRGYGNFVEIEHEDGVRTRYGHLSRIAVHPSERVGEGEVIGRVGSTGHSTGPHLHYEVRVNGVAVDPLRFDAEPGQSTQSVWGPARTVTARWTGWIDDPAEKSLPEASIR